MTLCIKWTNNQNLWLCSLCQKTNKNQPFYPALLQAHCREMAHCREDGLDGCPVLSRAAHLLKEVSGLQNPLPSLQLWMSLRLLRHFPGGTKREFIKTTEYLHSIGLDASGARLGLMLGKAMLSTGFGYWNRGNLGSLLLFCGLESIS